MAKGGYVRITAIKSIEQVAGNYGQQMKITVKDESDKFVSGWIPLERYNADDWQVGKSVDVTVEQKYYTAKDGSQKQVWNFKLPSKKQAIQPPAKSNEEVMNALREIFKVLKKIEGAVIKVSEQEQLLNEVFPPEDDIFP